MFGWVLSPCGIVDTNVSEKHTTSIFRVEDGNILTPLKTSNLRRSVGISYLSHAYYTHLPCFCLNMGF
jgi:hypothetical protein